MRHDEDDQVFMPLTTAAGAVRLARNPTRAVERAADHVKVATTQADQLGEAGHERRCCRSVTTARRTSRSESQDDLLSTAEPGAAGR